ncbi:MAG TPA: phenylacetic acid degradation b [Roseivirga sp.]
MLESLDPRVNRLGLPNEFETPMPSKELLDQFETYEAFVQTKEGKPFEHVGIVHAPNEEMAFLFAKEQYSRRGMFCNSLCVIKTENIKVTPYSENDIDIYNTYDGKYSGSETSSFEVFHLIKRGKQHKYEGNVLAKDYDDAILAAKESFSREKPVLNVWVVQSEDIFVSDDEDKDIWDTLKEKQYRDAIDYKASDKIKAFKESQAS